MAASSSVEPGGKDDSAIVSGASVEKVKAHCQIITVNVYIYIYIYKTRGVPFKNNPNI